MISWIVNHLTTKKPEQVKEKLMKTIFLVYSRFLYSQVLKELGEYHEMWFSFQYGKPAHYDPFQKCINMIPIGYCLYDTVALSCTNSVLKPAAADNDARVVSVSLVFTFSQHVLFPSKTKVTGCGGWIEGLMKRKPCSINFCWPTKIKFHVISNTKTMYMEVHCSLVRNHMEFYFGTIM